MRWRARYTDLIKPRKFDYKNSFMKSKSGINVVRRIGPPIRDDNWRRICLKRLTWNNNEKKVMSIINYKIHAEINIKKQ